MALCLSFTLNIQIILQLQCIGLRVPARKKEKEYKSTSTSTGMSMECVKSKCIETGFSTSMSSFTNGHCFFTRSLSLSPSVYLCLPFVAVIRVQSALNDFRECMYCCKCLSKALKFFLLKWIDGQFVCVLLHEWLNCPSINIIIMPAPWYFVFVYSKLR